MLRFGGEDMRDLRQMVTDAPTVQDVAILLRDAVLNAAGANPTRNA